MKFISIIFLILISNYTFASEHKNGDVEVINLYESKSLDQLVLENLNQEEDMQIIKTVKNMMQRVI